MGIVIEGGIAIEEGISIAVDYGIPTNTVAPVISVATPNVRVGKTLTSTTGTWTGSFPILGYNYQWYADSIIISGATANTYVIQSGDLGKFITCQVIAYSTYGNGLPATSNILGPVLPAVVTPTIGDVVYGGYYAGLYASAFVNDYYLIVAPASTESTGTYSTAYAACEALSINGYSDWHLPGGLDLIGNGGYNVYPIMYSASVTATWPSSQAYYTTPTSARFNYWTNASASPPSSLVDVYRFYNASYDFVVATNSGVSYRAIRFEPIPT